MPLDRTTLFSHLNADKSRLYRRVMRAFLDDKRNFGVSLRPEEVRRLVEDPSDVTVDDVSAELVQLVAWGNLRSLPDTERVTTVEDFNRPRFLYQLSPAGEAAELALERFDELLERRGELQAVALADIRYGLRSLMALVASDDLEPAKAHGLLRDLTSVFEGLAQNAQVFMSGLQRTIDLHDTDVDAFLAYKDRLIGYLERFIGDLVVASNEISEMIRGADERVDALLGVAAAREAQDAAPDALSAGEAEAALLEEWRRRWNGLRHWFVGDRRNPSQASLLRAQARAAIPALLTVVATLNQRRSGYSDRSADFQTLAVWFAQAPSDAAAHRLWRAAFALTSARHLAVDADTLARREDHPVPASTSWHNAEPVHLSPRLRATGSYERRGAPSKVVDRSEQRRLLTKIVATESAQTAEARRRFATGEPMRLSALGALDAAEFGLFLQLLTDALATSSPGRDVVTTSTADATLLVTLEPIDDDAVAEIITAGGTFRGLDHVITVIDLDDPALETASSQ